MPKIKKRKAGGKLERIASKGLRKPRSLTKKQIRVLAASALTQSDHRKSAKAAKPK